MKNIVKRIPACAVITMILTTVTAAVAFAADTAADASDAAAQAALAGDKALAAAIAIGLAAATGAISMGISISRASEGISRQPEAGGQIRTSLMLGLVFIETAIIYALIVAILIIFVL